jgi:hypothetical protein
MAQRGLVGIWTTDSCPISLGGILNFIFELSARARRDECSFIDLCFLDATMQEGPHLSDATGICTVAHAFTLVRKVVKARSAESIVRSYYSENVTYWPGFEPRRSDYTTSQNLLGLVSPSELGAVPLFKPVIREAAQQRLARLAGSRIPVAVHLKSNPHNPGSNALADVWAEFFAAQERVDRHRFITVGNDPLPPSISQRSNVVAAGGPLELDLAIIPECKFFLGMANGPAHVAALWSNPYLIIKHPTHHAAEMKAELGDANHLWFARPNQMIERVVESAELLNDFLEVFTEISAVQTRTLCES